MGIGKIASTNNMPVMQMPSTGFKDHKSKNIQNEITQVQQQLQKLSSAEELSANEKADERKKLQKEKSGLDSELKQHQEELLRAQKREAMLAELRKEQGPVKAEDTEDVSPAAKPSADDNAKKETPSANEKQAQPLQPGTVISQSSDGTVILKEVMNSAGNDTAAAESRPVDETKETAAAAEEADTSKEEADPAEAFRPTTSEMQAMVSADNSTQIADRMGTLVAKTEDGIAVLKGEIKLDAYRGTDTDRKEAELADMQKRSKRETAFQFSLLGTAESGIQTASETDPAAKTGAQANTERTFQVSGLGSAQQEEEAAQQGFQVSIA